MSKIKRMLTIEDLVMFCENHNFAHFSSKESGYQICVQVPALFEADDADESMLFANVLAFHTGVNNNRSNLTQKAAKKAIKNLPYKPVLANFCEIDGVRDFTSHDMEIDDDGNFVYIEKQIGCFTADPARMEKDPDHDDRMNIFARVAIPRDYTDAAEIIERKGGTDVSVELGVNELSWNSKEKVLVLEDVTIMGLTLLGKNPDTGENVKPGMEGAHIELEDFSAENNSVIFSKSELINEITQAVINSLDNHNKTTERRNDEVEFEEKIEEAVEEVFEKTADDISDVEPTEEKVIEVNSDDATEESPEVVKNESVEDNEQSDEPTEVFADDDPDDGNSGSDDPTDGPTDEPSDDPTDDPTGDPTDDPTDDTTDDQTGGDEPTGGEQDDVDENTQIAERQDDNGKKLQNELTYSVTIDGVTKTFSISLVEKLNALSMLVNSTYGETDQTYYDIDAYDDEKVVIMHDYWNNKHYRQSYAVKKDIYSLKGDRVECFARYLTADEISRLDSLKADYAEKSEKLAKYESEPEKMEILNSADYSNIADQDDFIALKQQSNHFDLSVDELKAKADAMLLAYAKAGKLNFATIQEPQKKEEPKKDFFAFARIEPKTDFLDKVLAEKK